LLLVATSLCCQLLLPLVQTGQQAAGIRGSTPVEGQQ